MFIEILVWSDVTTSIEEANVLIEDNKKKAHNTKEVIDDLANMVENLVTN